MRTHIFELAIIGGNVRKISPLAFSTQFTGNIRSLILERITITDWERYMLVGLTRLEELDLKSVTILNIERNALEAVDNTLETLTITTSGVWSPVNVTGSANLVHLKTVDFSLNAFDSIKRESFTNLEVCEVLFLNSCGIKSIEPGAFDYLANIIMLHLNDNFLVTIPVGLFRIIASNVNLRVNLQNNRWLCDCALADLRLLSKNDMMLVDPICYFPEYLQGTSMRKFFNDCANNAVLNDTEKYIHTSVSCDTDNYTYSYLRVVSPIDNFTCTVPKWTGMDLKILQYTMEVIGSEMYSGLLKPTLLVTAGEFSMIEISSTKPNRDLGIMWYHTKCPHEIYCLSILPNFLRIYGIEDSSFYTFCPLQLSSGSIKGDECILLSSLKNKICNVPFFTFYIYVAIASLILGSLFVYLMIRQFPFLLKGNKRILFVKNRNVDALVLPPQIPLRTKLDTQKITDNNTQIFTVAEEKKYFLGNYLKRTKSMLSTKSNAPSYVSALQPTEEQLVDWRLRHHFENKAITSISSYVIDESSLYCSLDQFSNKAHDIMK